MLATLRMTNDFNQSHTNGDDFCFNDEVDEQDIDIEEEDTTLYYFAGLFRSDKAERDTFFKNLKKAVQCWIDKKDVNPTAASLLKAHLPTVLRLSMNAPFRDIRENAFQILHELKELGHSIPQPLFMGPSSFIPQGETITYGNEDRSCQVALSQVQSIYEETFLHDGRLSNIVQVLAFHPTYLTRFTKTHDFLMEGNGPLALDVRNYIAILAASRHKCSYLVTMQEQEFLKHDGDPRWLEGLQHLPPKMKNLLNLNKLLAHQAWFVKPDIIKDLVTGADSWSVSELVHAVAIMAHFHAVAGFALGCGINPEIDTALGHAEDPKNIPVEISHCSNPALGIGGRITSDSDVTDSGTISPLARSPTHPGVLESRVHHFIQSSNPKTTDQILNGALKNLEETLIDCDKQNMADKQKMADSLMVKLQLVKDESSSDEESVEHKNLMFEDAASSAGMDIKRPKVAVPTPVSLVHYLEDPDYEHEDFTHSSAMTLRARDYSWEDHGFPFLTRVYPDLGPLLEDRFKEACRMTYRRVADKRDVDTEPFRLSIWYYIHSIKGIRHDDYNYRRVNQMLDIPFKTYVRMVTCFPEKATSFDFDHSMGGLDNSEKVHVNILILEARLQAELIYGLRAIMTCMK